MKKLSSKVHQEEIKNIKKNFLYADRKINIGGKISITETLYWQARTAIIELPSHSKDQKVLAEVEKSRQQILELRLAIRSGAQLPAIALIKGTHGKKIADGNHRIVALYEEGVKEHEAILLEE